MKRKIIKAVAIATIILSCCLTPLLGFNLGGGGASAVTAVEETDMKVYFFSDNEKDAYGNLIPDGTGKITVGVSIRKKSDGLKFSLKTRNKSAIAGNDYEAKSSDFHIVTTETAGATQYFNVQTIQTDASNLIESGKSDDYSLTRVFEIVICDMVTDSGCVATVVNDWDETSGKSSFDCRTQTQYDYEYSKKTGKDGYYFTDYLNGSSFSSMWIDRYRVYRQTPSKWIGISVDDDESYSFSTSFSRFISSDYIEKYRKDGWADVYYGGSANIYESGWCMVDTPAKLSLKGSDGKDIFYSEYYDPKSSGAPILFGETKYAGNNNSDYRYKLTNAAKTWLNNHTGYSIINTEDPMYRHTYCYYTQKDYNFPTAGKVYKNNSDSLSLSITRDSSWQMVFQFLRIDSELYDNNAPKIKGTWFDEITSTDNKVMRISVRFTEPVHLPVNYNTNNLTMTAYANGQARTSLSFVYAGGEGTDTLYFDCDLSQYENDIMYAGTPITSVVFNYYSDTQNMFSSACRDIADYAYNFSQSNNIADLTMNTTSYAVNIDLRSPVVTATIASGDNYLSTAKTHTVNISVANMTASGSALYYTWVKAEEVTDPSTYVVDSYTNCESRTPMFVNAKGEKMDGEYYLFYKAQSAYGKTTTGYYEKKLSFDNTAAEIADYSFGSPMSSVKSRELKLVFDGEVDDLVRIQMLYRVAGTTSQKTMTLYDSTVTGTASVKPVYDEATQKSTAVTNITGTLLGLDGGESGSYYFTFVTTDSAGNQSTFTLPDPYMFDTSDRCKVNVGIAGTVYDVYDTINVDASVTTINGSGSTYKNTYYADGFGLTFTLTDGSSSILSVGSAMRGSENITATISDYFDIDASTAGTLKMTYTAETGGYFTIRLACEDKASDVFTFYLAGADDSTIGYDKLTNDCLIANKLYSISDISYYWLSGNNTVATSENYNPTKKLSLVFSSQDRARDFYRFTEMQDLTLLYLDGSNEGTSSIVANLNNNGATTAYRKAKGELMTASAGQTWIRYKNANWDQSSDSSEWVYYYYSAIEETTISTSMISSNLQSAITSVVEKIVAKGTYSYLTSDDGLDANGVPYVDESRIYAQTSVAQTKTGTPFNSILSYNGDSEIYKQYYADDNGNGYDIAVQEITASDYTSIYFTAHNGTTYEKLDTIGTFRFKDVIRGTGIYDIVERDENGARKYSVYVDNTAPTLKIVYDNNNGTQYATINASYVGGGLSLNTKSFALESLSDSDEYAYVAIFTSAKKLKQTVLADELGSVSLSEGKYIIEVYDRSGNGYSFNLRISLDDLSKSCSISNEKNNRVRFTCSYPKDDIYRFEIYLDGVLIDKTKTDLDSNSAISLYEGGTYRFYVEDIFGNVYDETSTLVRELPQVTWYYEQNGSFVKYDPADPTATGLSITKLGSTNYLVTSCGRVRFNYSSDYTIEVLKGDEKNGDYTDAKSARYVTFNILDNWQVKISYTNYKDVFVIYTGKSDTSAPTILATTNRAKYSYADENDDALDNYIGTIMDSAKEGDVINFSNVSFKQEDLIKEVISSGDVISGSLVCIMVSDLSGVKKWTCVYNGTTTEYGNNSGSVYFGKVGKYTITAVDVLGNISTFMFEIGKTEYTEIDIDGITASATKTNYGNTSLSASLYGAGAFVFVLDGEYYRLTTDGTNLVRTITKISKIEKSATDPQVVTAIETVETEEVWAESLTATSKTVKTTDNCSISAYLKDGTVHLDFVLNKDGEHTAKIKIRAQSNEGADSKYVEAELSNKLTYINYASGERSGVLDKTIYINSDCTLYYSDDITTYFVWYSPVDNFDNEEFYIYPSDGVNDAVLTREGFYRVQTFNRYGNDSIVKVMYSKSIAIVGSVEFTDGTSIIYSGGYDGDLYSNYSAVYSVYGTATYSVTKDGAEYRASITETDDGITIKITGVGNYTVTITDNYGNVVTKYAHIDNTALVYSENWLTGWNDNAIKKADGYTNNKLSFGKDLKTAVSYVSYIYNDTETIVYDALGENTVAFNSGIVIGANGDGTYEIVFRDKYGNRAVKTVNYRENSPLVVTRLTRSMEKETYYMANTNLDDGIWSNKTISFECTANVYNFYVNSEKRDIPYSIEFPTNSENGKFVYSVRYLDEYGFMYSFDCVLYRTPIELDTGAMAVENGVTRDAVAVSFDSNYTAFIAIDGGAELEYNSGDKYYRDGNYVISVYDRAGNVLRYSVRRDSVVSYKLYTTSTENTLASGEITNENTVYFAPASGEEVSYCMVYHDGVKQDDFNFVSFTESGKWELIVKDAIGNKDYFCFYIVKHSLLSFDYTTPYGYTVTEATYDGGGGKVDCIDSIKSDGEHSSMAFDQTGEYSVVMTSSITGKTAAFTVTIDKTVPKIVLDGVENGGTTKNDVKISGCKTGDTVYIYKDGKLMKTVKVVSQADIPDITEKGSYRVVVVNEAGGQSEVEFTRVYTANVATSSLIIVIVIAIVIGLFTGLLFRKRSRSE